MGNVIPDYDNRGLLPRGEHHTSLEKFIERFVNATDLKTRSNLFQKYTEFSLLCLETQALLFHYVNGSYVTNKEKPNDIDLLVIFDGLTVDTGPDELYNIYSELDNRDHVKETYSCHVWCVLEYPPEEYKDMYDYFNAIKIKVMGWWQTNFTDVERANHDPEPKGVIVLPVEEIEKFGSL